MDDGNLLQGGKPKLFHRKSFERTRLRRPRYLYQELMNWFYFLGAGWAPSGETGALSPRALQHYVLLLGWTAQRTALFWRVCQTAGAAAAHRDGLYRAGEIPRPFVLQPRQSLRRETVNSRLLHQYSGLLMFEEGQQVKNVFQASVVWRI